MLGVDCFLRSHSDDVADYAAAIADRLGLDTSHCERVALGALLHDVGKLAISRRILMKPARLTADEYAIVKLHPGIGARAVLRFAEFARAAPAVLHHHERFDGTGYPARLAADAIPLEARIVAVADAFSAMVSDRPYRAGCSPDAAFAELERCAGTQFDPEVVAAFQPCSSGAMVSPASLSCSQ